MIILGYGFAVLMGLTLGTIGGGGSILTVPILVYLLGVEPVQATAYSLLVVGLTALVGAWRYHLKGLIAYKVGAYFALPSVLGVWAARAFILPLMPEVLYQNQYIMLGKNAFLMLFFAGLMVSVALFMGRPAPTPPQQKKPTLRPGLIATKGLIVGVVTGVIGAGGGFLIVPALVFFAQLPIKNAIATSLAIIAAKSLIGFTGDLHAGFTPAPFLTILFTGLTVLGMLAGVKLAHKATDTHLKKAFSWLVAMLGVAIFVDQLRHVLL